MEILVKTAPDNLSVLLRKDIDGVIVGVEGFTARMEGCVAPETLTELAAQTNSADKRLWLNLNSFVHETDLPALKDLVDRIASLPVAGVLFSDFAVLRLARQAGISARLVYHAETAPTFAADVLFFENQGIKAVVLGRELTIKAIESIAAATKLPLAFVGHGHLNMFHSRRRLLSSYFAHTQSGRRGVGPEKAYTLREEGRSEYYPVYEDAHGTHIFRAAPLQSFTVWERLDPVLSHFIIDGHMYDEKRLMEIVDDYIAVRAGKLDGRIEEKYADHDEGFYRKETFAKEVEGRNR